uniref:Uncharacterized protein n=1 Tax=Arundo donax TaxID=35708 RepID=A0A0A8ZLB7_ARUDO
MLSAIRQTNKLCKY